MLALTAGVLVTFSAAPLADVWPYAVKRAPDGALEYAFDLTPLKASKGPADAVELHGEDAVKKFLSALPKSATVRVVAGGGVDLSAGRELEWGTLATSFAQVGDGPYTSDNPLAKRAAARLRAPLDPEEPKLLPSVDVVTFRVRQLEDAALAAVALDTDALVRQLLSQVADRAAKRFRSLDGDAREGALALAARAQAAAACLDEAKLPKGDPDVLTAARAEVQRLTADPNALVPPAPWSRTAEVGCAWIRSRALAQPFENSRAGTAAVLTYLLVLEKDAKLAALAERLAQRRDRYVGAPAANPLATWKEKAKGDAEGAMDRLNEFIDALPMSERRPPGLVAAATTPFGQFLGQLEGAELGAAMEELAAAAGDGRVALPADGAWPVAREAALAALVQDSPSVHVDGAWRGRLRGAFAALQVAHLDARGGGLDLASESLERNGLLVRLNVPPVVDVEPRPEVYARFAASLERLVKALSSDGLSGLQGLEADGRRGAPVVGEAKRWISRLQGLAKLAGAGMLEGADVAEARRFLATWRSEAGGDVRQAAAAPVSVAGERRHGAIVGVSRRELVVGFSGKPALEVVGAPAGLSVRAGEQRYLVPVLVTAGATAASTKRALDVKALKVALDETQRDAAKAEGAFSEALAK